MQNKSELPQKRVPLEKSDDPAWRETVSGRVFAHLEGLAGRSRDALTVHGMGSPVEVFEFRGERAELITHLDNSTVGDTEASIRKSVESWDYKRIDWWREAISATKAPVDFLDPPLSRAARDAGIEKWEETFVPGGVVQRFSLATEGDWKQEEAMREWVRTLIKEILDPLVRPDYRIVFYEECLRLNPLTESASASRFEDNETYRRVLEKIAIMAPALEKEYRRKAEKIHSA